MDDRIRGVNLSGWFIPEPWVTPSLFAATGASTDAELQENLGTVEYNERIRQHYETFITEEDFRRMSSIGLNAVRIPVPWHVFGLQNDAATYISAIDYIDRAMEWGSKYNVSVLLDLATVPGGQGDSNEPQTTSRYIADWHSSTNGRHVALEVLERLAARYAVADALYGIELLDSPVMSVRKNMFTMTDGIPGHYLRNFYRDAYDLLRKHMTNDKAVVFSASGYPGLWKHFMRSSQYKNVMMDVHLYHYHDENAQDITSPRAFPLRSHATRPRFARRWERVFPSSSASGLRPPSCPALPLRPKDAPRTSAFSWPTSLLLSPKRRAGSSRRGRRRSASPPGMRALRWEPLNARCSISFHPLCSRPDLAIWTVTYYGSM